MSEHRKLLGVDYGTVRVGLAITDEDRRLAMPLDVLHRHSPERDAEWLQALVQDQRIGEILIGLPVHTNGQEGAKAKEARAYGEWLHKLTRLPVRYWDERFTSVEAEHLLQERNLTKKKRKKRLDGIAAQLMLQSYLDAGCPEDDEGSRAMDE